MAKDNKKGAAKHIMGPYENWALGLGGKYLSAKRPPSSGGASSAGGVQYAAFAIFSEAVTSADIEPQPGGSQKFQPPRFPTIWAPAGGQAKYTAFPLIVQVSDLNDVNTRKSDIKQIKNWVAFVEEGISKSDNGQISLKNSNIKIKSIEYGMKEAEVYGAIKTPIGEADAATQIERRAMPGLRLNVPIAEDTIDTAFRQAKLAKIENLKAANEKTPQIPKIVIMAVIDDGIAFAHANFREKGGRTTRIESCWLQSALPDPRGAHSVAFGNELFAEDINALLKSQNNDEAAIYAGIAMSEADKVFGNPWRKFSTHGTHVLDIAAGHRHDTVSPSGPVPDAQNLDAVRIIAVQLPASAIANTAGFGKDAYVLSAFHHIFQRADEIFDAYKVEKPEDQCLIVNFSFGITAGPDDGTNPVAAAISDLIKQRRDFGKPTYVTMPAGNTFSSALYGEVTAEVLKGKNEYIIPWRIQPNSRTSNHLELWFEDTDAIDELAVFAPGNKKLFQKALNGGAFNEVLELSNEKFGLVSYSAYSAGRWHAVISLAPTDPEDASAPATPAGLWQIHLKLKKTWQKAYPLVRCRIQRNDSPYGYWTGARQSYFDDPEDIRFGDRGDLSEVDHPDAFVQRFGSLNGWATANGIWIVGGVIKDREKPSPASAAGRLTSINGNLAFVDIGAPSDDSRHLPGRLAAGTMSSSVARISGTSVAAPYVARCIALTVLAGQKVQRVSDLKGAKSVSGKHRDPPHIPVRLGNIMVI